MDNNVPAVVLDNGSSVCKAGLAGEENPNVLFEPALANVQQGNEVRRPITRGVVTDWSAMEELWKHVFAGEELRGATPSNGHPVLVTEPPLGPNSNREFLAQYLFEAFDAPALHIAVPAVLAMYASGRATGTVLDSGDGVTHIVPVYEGYTVRTAVVRENVGGSDITEYLAQTLGVDSRTAKGVKEQFCYVAADYQQEKQRAEQGPAAEQVFELPDGRTLNIGDTQFRASEGLFGANFLGLAADGIHDMAFNCIAKCDLDCRRLLYNNIILSGGNTLFSGIGERLKREVTALAPPGISVQVLTPPKRAYSAWFGGSILASLSTFQKALITLAEYNEIGPAVVHAREHL